MYDNELYDNNQLHPTSIQPNDLDFEMDSSDTVHENLKYVTCPHLTLKFIFYSSSSDLDSQMSLVAGPQQGARVKSALLKERSD